jgi:hypothetical protein
MRWPVGNRPQFLSTVIQVALMRSRTERTDGAANKETAMATTTKQNRPKAIDGYRIQPMLPMSFPYFGATVIDADFHCYDDAGWCVDVSMTLGIVKGPYTLVLTIDQAREADIIERA